MLELYSLKTPKAGGRGLFSRVVLLPLSSSQGALVERRVIVQLVCLTSLLPAHCCLSTQTPTRTHWEKSCHHWKASTALQRWVPLPAPSAWALAETPCLHFKDSERVWWIELSSFGFPFQVHTTSRHPKMPPRFFSPPFLVRNDLERKQCCSNLKGFATGLSMQIKNADQQGQREISSFHNINLWSTCPSFLPLTLFEPPSTHLMRCSFHSHSKDLWVWGDLTEEVSLS